MSIVCQNPDCDHEFSDAVMHDELAARQAGETPFFTHVHEPEDSIGVATDCLCSASCLSCYLKSLEVDA